MTAQRIIQHIFKEPGLEKVTQWELEKLVTDYPFFTAARVLLAKRAYQRSSDLQHEAVIKALLYTHTPHYFYQFVQSAPDQAPAPPETYTGDLTANAAEVPEITAHATAPDTTAVDAATIVSPASGIVGWTADEIPAAGPVAQVTEEIVSPATEIVDWTVDEIPATQAAGPVTEVMEETPATEPASDHTIPAAAILETAAGSYSTSAPELTIALQQPITPDHAVEAEPEKPKLSFHEEMEAFRRELAEQTAREQAGAANVTAAPVISQPEPEHVSEKTSEDTSSDFHLRMQAFRQSLLAAEDTAEEGAIDQTATTDDTALLQNFNVHSFQDELEALKNRLSVTENDAHTLEDTLETGAHAAAGELTDHATPSPEALDATRETGAIAPTHARHHEPATGEVSVENETTLQATLEAGALEAGVQTENQQGQETPPDAASRPTSVLPEFMEETPVFAGIGAQHEPETAFATEAAHTNITENEAAAFSAATLAGEASALAENEPAAFSPGELTTATSTSATPAAGDDIPSFPEGTLAGEISTWDEEDTSGEAAIPAFTATHAAAETAALTEDAVPEAAQSEQFNASDIQLVSDAINDQLPVPSALPAETEETWTPMQQPSSTDDDIAAQLHSPAADSAVAEDLYEDGPIKIYPLEMPEETDLTFQPLYTDDYFAYKKLQEPQAAEKLNEKGEREMKSFTNWLRTMKDSFAEKSNKDWYHEQLHRVYEEEEESGISERVEKMALQSITLNDDIVSETLAEIWAKQRQHQKAIQIYKKLSLLNPGKSAYFAQKINELQSDINK